MITLGHLANPASSPLLEGQLIGNLSSICNLNSPSPHKAKYSQILGTRAWESIEGTIILSTIMCVSFVGLFDVQVCISMKMNETWTDELFRLPSLLRIEQHNVRHRAALRVAQTQTQLCPLAFISLICPHWPLKRRRTRCGGL